jgi:dTDP-4-dehydrorhamnose reductase
VKLLVFGAHGQVARALAAARPGDVVLAGRERLDLAADAPDVAGLIAAERPDAVINAAAYTAVDQAESEPEACARLNREAARAIGEACAARHIPLAHLSTDYVFDGSKGAPYVEGDTTHPLNVYGLTKRDGEAILAGMIADGARIAVVRTAWVFSASGRGFLGAMRRAAVERDEVRVVADQWGSPTSADACADAALVLTAALLDRDERARGVFHAAGGEGMNWADFADAIFALTPRRPRLTRITAAEYPTAARRPRDTRLSSARIEAAFGWRAPPLAEALAATLTGAGAAA